MAPTKIETLIIREATFEDLPAIVQVFLGDSEGGHGDAWSEETRPLYEAAMWRILASESNTLFVADIDGAVVGTFQVTLIPGLVGQGRTRAKIESVHVTPSRRGQRIGEQMMLHALAFAKGRGAGIAELSSNKARTAAHRFYERLGFERSHEGFKFRL